MQVGTDRGQQTKTTWKRKGGRNGRAKGKWTFLRRQKTMRDTRPPQQPCGSKPREKLLRAVSKLSKTQTHLSCRIKTSLPKETTICIVLANGFCIAWAQEQLAVMGTWGTWRAWGKVLRETPPRPTGGTGEDPPGFNQTTGPNSPLFSAHIICGTEFVSHNFRPEQHPAELQTP